MKLANSLRAAAAAAALAVAAVGCSGSDISSPGATQQTGPTSPTNPTNPTQPTNPFQVTSADCVAAGATFVNNECVLSLPNNTVTGTVTLGNAARPTPVRIPGILTVGSDVGGGASPAPGGALAAPAAVGAPAELRILPGTTVYFDNPSDYILINRGSKIIADGTADAPIVFTSRQDVQRLSDNDPTNDAPVDTIQEWGGIVILGRAPINNCVPQGTPTAQVGCEAPIEGITNPTLYGGGDENDNSGILRYVQVRYAGFPLPGTTGNELNGITFGGVGRGTTVEFVQVHNGSDDGVEFFGGTVNARYLVLTGIDDDSIDTDAGYRGNIQFALVRQRSAGGDRIIEASNVRGNSNTPLSNPTLSNFTFIGARNQGIVVNGGGFRFANGVVVGSTDCADTAGANTAGGVSPVFNSVVFDCPAGLGTGPEVGQVAAGSNNLASYASTLSPQGLPGANELARNATAVNPTTLNAGGSNFFQPASYVGAFGPNETATNNWATGWTFNLFPATPGCPAGTTETGATFAGQRLCDLPGNGIAGQSGVLTSSLRLTRGNIYRLRGTLEVGQDIGGQTAVPPQNVTTNPRTVDLTIEPGVTVFGRSNADYILVNRGSRLLANGRADAPVIFTSENDLLATTAAQKAARVDTIQEWGGIVLLGRAPINNCVPQGTPTAQLGCEAPIEGITTPKLYGGEVPGDNSGTLRFVQVKFAGFPLPGTTGNELNGITFGGVGTGTTLEFIQVHNGSDDGVEFFGGTVNARYLILTGIDDDSLDTDAGYNGSLQYVIARQRTGGGDRIIEASNVRGNSNTPLSNPTLANFTFVANRAQGIVVNGGGFTLANGVVVGAPGADCLETAGSNTTTPRVVINSVLFGCAADTDAADNAIVNGGADNSLDVAATLQTLAGTAFPIGPGSAETGRTAVQVSTLPAFFQRPNFLGNPANYIGAVQNAQDTWWRGWSCGIDSSTPC